MGSRGDPNSTKDPEKEASRIFVGGVAPGADSNELQKVFEKHGNVTGVSVFKGFAFVQFEKPEEAQKALAEENGREFMGNNLDVKAAKRNPGQNEDSGGRGNRGGGGGRGGRGGYQAPAPPRAPYGGYDGGGRGGGYYDEGPGYGGGGYGGNGGRYGPGMAPPRGPPQGPPERRNDCEIVCVSRFQRNYAESIENRLKNFGLKSDVLFPNPDIPLPKILGNIASRGVLYAVVVTPLNEEHKSMTVNILQGPQPQEHRNMPYDDAMQLVAKTFEKMSSNVGGPELRQGSNDDLPHDIRTVIGFLMDRRPLSVMEYDKLIKYLAQRREGVLREEYGDKIPADLAHPPIGPPVDPAVKAKQNELNERILNILNKPKPKPTSQSELDPSLQRAIDNLIRTGPNLLSQVQQSTSSSGGYGGGDSYYGGNNMFD